jgi:ABC-type Zn uptake system ZnuABC Zn-binding protein ZnuA
MRRRIGFWIALASLLLSACRTGGGTPPPDNLVLASTTILADITRNVAGGRREVVSLLPPGADPHEFQAAPSDVRRISASAVIVVNGLDYERFLGPLLENAGGQRLTITASDGLPPDRLKGSGDAGVADPHMWLDPQRVVTYVRNIRDGLSRADPDGAAAYRANAEAYIIQLEQLDAWIAGQVSAIPAERRLLVTNHESMGYFAGRYGFRVAATVIPSVSTEAGASAQELAAVIDQVRALGAPAIFTGKMENAGLARQIASETGAAVVDDLYLESLTAGPPAPTYIDMMKYDVSRILEALK